MISVIIPTHNRADLLRQSLQSIAQLVIPADKAVELLIVVDACADDTLKVCEEAAHNMPFSLRCLVPLHSGASHARNRAISEARGEILAFLDDDVWVDRHWLIGLLEVFETFSADIVAGKVTLWWKAVEKPAWLTHRSEHLPSSVDYGDQTRELFTRGEAITANLAIKRCVLADVPGFRTDLDRQGRTVSAGGDTYDGEMGQRSKIRYV